MITLKMNTTEECWNLCDSAVASAGYECLGRIKMYLAGSWYDLSIYMYRDIVSSLVLLWSVSKTTSSFPGCTCTSIQETGFSQEFLNMVCQGLPKINNPTNIRAVKQSLMPQLTLLAWILIIIWKPYRSIIIILTIIIGLGDGDRLSEYNRWPDKAGLSMTPFWAGCR